MKVILEKKVKNKIITTTEFDKKFDRGESVVSYLDIKKAKRPDSQISRIHIDLPRWAMIALDKMAKRTRTNPRSIIKTWLMKHLSA